jgi:hypothetical protein
MLTSILGARLSWHFANGWVFEPAIVGPDIVDYTLKEGPHAGRHAIQHFYFQRVAPGVETTVWYEESGALVFFFSLPKRLRMSSTRATRGSGLAFDQGLVRGKWRAGPYYLVFRDTNDAPLRCSSCLAGRRYDRLSG